MTQTRRCNYYPYIDEYIDGARSGEIISCKEIIMAMDYAENKLDDPDVFIDGETIEKGLELIKKYWGIEFFDWEKFVFSLIFCYYKSNDTVVFNKFFIMMGRGNGKNGFISPVIWFLITHYHNIKGYNVDIIANNQEQSMTSFNDVHEILESTKTKSKKFFYWTKEKIFNKKTNSYIKYNTSNARTKDGKRSACLVFDEIHEYGDYKNINVFTSGFGKRKHSRTFYITTNGYTRGGVLDKELEIANNILIGEITNLRELPLIYKIDDEKEYKNKKMWHKANPSLKYLENLRIEMEDAFINMEYITEVALDFMTKRMNIPKEEEFSKVANYEKIKATNQPIPDLKDYQCIGALDYAQVNDFASVGLLFKKDGKRIWIEHTFVCHKALKVASRQIKFPIQEAVDKGLITIVYEETIKPEYLATWFVEKSKKHQIMKIVADSYRFAYVEEKFKEFGLPLESVRSGPITHSKVAPIIQSLLYEENLVCGDNMTMRWYINNTCTKTDGKGNITFEKIEPKLRKTDGFFAFIHAMTKDSVLVEAQQDIMVFDVITF